MAVKKIYSDYQGERLRNLPQLQTELDKLNSYAEDHYIAQRDKYNQEQQAFYEIEKRESEKLLKEEKDKWNEMKENLKKYSKEYYQIILSHLFKPQEGNILLFKKYHEYNIDEFPGREPLYKMDSSKWREFFDPQSIKIPDEPTLTTNLGPIPIPLTDLESFKDVVRKKAQEIEEKIEKIKTETSNALSQSEQEPFRLDTGYWLYQNTVYDVTGKYSSEEKKLLIMEFAVKDRRRFERLQNKFSDKKSEEIKYERSRIPEEVRIAVWRRDQGRCARCGSRENLEYDHIVPVSKGGGNTERNIELLCQDCNRTKSNKIE